MSSSDFSKIARKIRKLNDSEYQQVKYIKILQTIADICEPLIKSTNDQAVFKVTLKKLAVDSGISDAEKIKEFKIKILEHHVEMGGINPLQQIDKDKYKSLTEGKEGDIYRKGVNKFVDLFTKEYKSANELCKKIGEVISNDSSPSNKIESIQNILICDCPTESD